ncbi:hypothetical protein THMIRHAM_04870 [Thiomicrorhabdus immobilis]|uniref:Oligosaccharide repeat unit polymerase n=1 Tax=Thiomicrorhabdus immobilis TaxID=2791037 RepID=A0ABN6CXQ5_9GAMM|nr:hypothetical protein THMIRHAM_04870 [Thiomicrorhabdus immobilis]
MSLMFLFALGVKFVKYLPFKNISTGDMLYVQQPGKRVLNFLFVLGVLGVVLKFFEHIFLHSAFSYSSLFEYKMSRMYSELNSGGLGVLSALLYPFGLVVLIFQINGRYFRNKIKVLFVWLVGVYWFFDALIMSSMTAIVYVFSMVFVAHVIANGLKGNQTNIPFFRVLLLTVLTISYFVYLTFFRVDVDFISVSLESKALFPNFEVNSVFLFSLLNFLHYVVHGVVEWFRLFNHVGLSNYYFGMYEFYPFVKLFAFLGFEVPTFSELASVAHKTGVYTSFWGPFILDFGALSFGMAFFSGIVSSYFYKGLFSGNLSSLLIYPVIAMQIIFSPIINIFSGVIIYYLLSAIISVFLIKTLSKRIVH